jgi:hypothetical protein
MPAMTEFGTLDTAQRNPMIGRKRSALAATISRASASARMVALRILRLLTMLAILLMPLGMIGPQPAAAMAGHASATMSADHCAGMAHKSKTAPAAPCCDCMVGCSAIPSQAPCVRHEAPAPMAAEPAALTAKIHGLHPEAATPPPRSSET